MSELALSNNRPNRLYAAGLLIVLAAGGTEGCSALGNQNENGPFVGFDTRARVGDVEDAYDALIESGSIGDDAFPDDTGTLKIDKGTAGGLQGRMMKSLYPLHMEAYDDPRDFAIASCVAADVSGAFDPVNISPLQELEQEYQDLANEKRKDRVATDIEAFCTDALVQHIKAHDAKEAVSYVLPPGGEW